MNIRTNLFSNITGLIHSACPAWALFMPSIIILALATAPLKCMNRVAPFPADSAPASQPIRIPIHQVMQGDDETDSQTREMLDILHTIGMTLPRSQTRARTPQETSLATARLIRQLTEAPSRCESLDKLLFCESWGDTKPGTLRHLCCSQQAACYKDRCTNGGLNPCCVSTYSIGAGLALFACLSASWFKQHAH